MSKTANWSYTNEATVRPLLSRDSWGEETYGTEYTIKCTWAAKSMQHKDADGREFVSKHEVYTEDLRPKYGDYIRLGTQAQFEQIRSVTEWDMSFFNEAQDVKLVTG